MGVEQEVFGLDDDPLRVPDFLRRAKNTELPLQTPINGETTIEKPNETPRASEDAPTPAPEAPTFDQLIEAIKGLSDKIERLVVKKEALKAEAQKMLDRL